MKMGSSRIEKFGMLTIGLLFSAFLKRLEGTTSSNEEEDLFKYFVLPAFEKVNLLRVEYGLSLLKLDDNLTNGAQEWAESESRSGEKLNHSCGPCAGFSELLAEKITTRKVPRGPAAVDWAFGRWFGNSTDNNSAYTELLKRKSLERMGIGIAYGELSSGEKTVFVVARFANVRPRYG